MEKKIMTKAEAFEYLKGKKVRTCGEPRLLEKKLMECGYRWMRGVTWENDDYEDFWAYFMGYDGLITFVDIECSDYYECHNFEDISADDILSIEIVEEKKVLSVDCALEHAKWIMKYLREECSPHTKMIIEGDHAELVEGVKSVVWKEDME
jgi:hypothetical protein